MIRDPHLVAQGGESVTRHYGKACAALTQHRVVAHVAAAPPAREEDTAYLLGVLVAAGVVHSDGTKIVVTASLGASRWLATMVRRLGGGLHLGGAPAGRRAEEVTMLVVPIERVAAIAALPAVAGGAGSVDARSVSPDHETAFWRGVVDGRGSIRWSPSGLWRLAVHGDAALADGFGRFLRERGITTEARVRTKGGGSAFELTGGADVRAALRLLYPGAPDELAHPEKARIAATLARVEGSRERRHRISPEWVARIREAGASEVELAAVLGVSRMTVWRWRRDESARASLTVGAG